MLFFWVILSVTAQLQSVVRGESTSTTTEFPKLMLIPPIYTPIFNDSYNVSNIRVEENKDKFSIPLYRPLTTECGIRQGYYFNRIVGGRTAEKGEFPWQVSLQLQTGFSARHICGGAILTPLWIITAAHCVNELRPNALSVVAGDHNLYYYEGTEQRRGVAKIITRGFYLPTFANDIALLRLNEPLKLNQKNVAPICIPRASEVFDGMTTVSGWGRLSEEGDSPQVLQVANLQMIDMNTCSQKYSRAGYGNYINACQICSGLQKGGRDACQGDSGGPLICLNNTDGRYYLCGIVSWGVGCARAEFPGVYTKVSCYTEWIKSIIERGYY